MDHFRSNTGFSFVELLACVAIIGVLASVAIPLAEVHARRSREAELRNSLREIRSAIDAYRAAVRDGIIDAPPLSSGYPPNLEDLAAGVQTKTGGRTLYFLRRIPRDPLHPDSSVPAASTWGLRSYDSSPDRPRPGADVYDVFSTSLLRGLNGVEYAKW